MSFIEKLERLMADNGIRNNSELSKVSGIPYTTIDGFYKKGTDNIKLSTLRKLSDCLNCSLDYLVDDSHDEPLTLAAHFEGEKFSEDEMKEIMQFVDFVKSRRK